MVGVSSLLFATPVLILELCRVTVRSGELCPGWGRFSKGLFFLSGPMKKPLAGCQLQRVAGERLPSLPGDQADDYPVGEGEEKKKLL